MNEPLGSIIPDKATHKKMSIPVGIAIVMAIIFVEESIAYALVLSYILSLLIGKQLIDFPVFSWGNGALTPKTVFMSILFFMAVKMGSSIPLEFIPGYEKIMEGYLDQFGGLGLPVMIIASIITPVVEEVYFRGRL